jgi:hypothetical protein
VVEKCWLGMRQVCLKGGRVERRGRELGWRRVGRACARVRRTWMAWWEGVGGIFGSKFRGRVVLSDCGLSNWASAMDHR